MAYSSLARRNEYARKHYRENKPLYLDRNRRQRSRIKTYIQEAKNTLCEDCKKRYPYYVMDFDHRPGEVKLFEPNTLSRCGSLQTVKAELSKCDVVCSNCHRIRTHQRRSA